jgi:hypothetical protein
VEDVGRFAAVFYCRGEEIHFFIGSGLFLGCQQRLLVLHLLGRVVGRGVAELGFVDSVPCLRLVHGAFFDVCFQ